MVKLLVPEDPITWKDVGLGGVALAALTMMGKVLWILVKGTGTSAKEQTKILQEELKATREMAERHHAERMDADAGRHQERLAADEKRHNETSRMLVAMEGRLHHFSNMLGRMSAILSMQKANDNVGMEKIMEAIGRRDQEDLKRQAEER